MMMDVPSSISLATPARMARDPDGINLNGVEPQEEASHQLEPSGSRHDEEQHAPTMTEDEVVGEGRTLTALEIKQIIGVPPPPPPGQPPKRNWKKNQSEPSTEKLRLEPDCTRDDCNVEDSNMNTERIESVASSPPELENLCEPDVFVSNDQTHESTAEIEEKEDNVEEPSASNINMTTKSQKRAKKRGFFKKLFKGGKKVSTPTPKNEQMVSVSGNKAVDSLQKNPEDSLIINIEPTKIDQPKSADIQEPESIVQVYSIDPPDEDNGDPPEDATAPSLENTMSKDPMGSTDPLGSSPVAQDNARISQSFSADPKGATPTARACRIASNDPIGLSYTFESKIQAKVLDSVNSEPIQQPNLASQVFDSPEKVAHESSEVVDVEVDQKDSLTITDSVNTDDVPIKKPQIDIEKRGFTSSSAKVAKKPLSVAVAAFTNAKAMAYLHQLDGEPSPRNVWSSNNSIAPPLSEESIALAKIRAFSSKRKKGKVRTSPKFAGPSPDDYCATNAEIEALIKEKSYVKHDPNKTFAPYSRFKGRLPRREGEEEMESEMLEMQSEVLVLDSIVPAQRLMVLALERGAELRQLKREGKIVPESSVRKIAPSGPKSFNFFPLKESTIKNPVQRAGRRLLSKAAVPIQSGIRMYLAKKEVTNRMWALIRIQSYFRRWKCEATLRAHKEHVMMLQKICRGIQAREQLKKRNRSATLIQKIVRGYLAALHAYEAIYFITRAQAVARGFLVRASNARKAKELKDIILVQSIVRRRLAIRSADLIRKSVYSAFIIQFQALWRGHSERNRLQRNVVEKDAAIKIQAYWRGYQAYSNFIFDLVDILIVQRTARQWLAVRQANRLRRERANVLFIQNRAATAIQKSWRGFWGYSHFVIVRYETTRIQAMIRGKLERNRFNLKVGCAILIQAAARRFLVKKQASQKVVEKALLESRILEMRERHSAIHIQFWWRIVLDWMKEKKAALVIERFFIFVKREVDRELHKMERQRIMEKRNSKKVKNGPKLDKEWMDAEGAFSPLPVVKKPPAVKKNSRRKSAPSPRPPKTNLVVKDTKNYQAFPARDDYGFLDFDINGPPSVLNLAPSCDFSMVSNLTNPQFTTKAATRSHSEEVYEEVKARTRNEKPKRLSTDDYIKKYSSGLKTAPNKSQSQHFFSDEKSSGTREKKRQSLDGSSTTKHRQRQGKISTPRDGEYDIFGSQTFEGFEVVGKRTASTRSSSTGKRSGSTPRNASTIRSGTTPRNRGGHFDIQGSQTYDGFEAVGKPPAAPRRSPSQSSPSRGSPSRNSPSRSSVSRSSPSRSSPNRRSSTPRKSSTPRNSSTPRHGLPPVTPTRKKTVMLMRSATSVTECSTPVESQSPKMYIPTRPRSSPRRTPVRIMKTNPNFMDDQTIEEAHEMMLLGLDYGEV